MLHRILTWLNLRPRRLHCACGAPILVYDEQRGYCGPILVYDEQRGYCGPCYVKTIGG